MSENCIANATSASQALAQIAFDPTRVRHDFPILEQMINGHPLVYLDNAATTQKPTVVIDAICHYYRTYNSNVHRGAHYLSDKATAAFEDARGVVADFLNSPNAKQIIWTRGTTESVNLVAQTWGRANITSGDIILVSALEHHSNIVPWQMLAQEKGAQVVPMAVTAQGDIDLEALAAKFADAAFVQALKFVSLGQVSNALGTVNPIEKVIELAHSAGAKVLIDGAQAVAHFPIDVQALDCDFYAFSGHKLFGPTGIGVLWGKESLLNAMPPFHGGGEMIETVSFDGTTYNGLPYKFEAGTPDIAGVIGLAAAINYLNQFDRQAIIAHERALLAYAVEKSAAVPRLKRVGTAKKAAGVFSFLIDGAHPSDIGMLLDQQGIAIRTGHHCAQPLMQALQIPGTARASFSIYTTMDDVDQLFVGLNKVISFL